MTISDICGYNMAEIAAGNIDHLFSGEEYALQRLPDRVKLRRIIKQIKISLDKLCLANQRMWKKFE